MVDRTDDRRHTCVTVFDWVDAEGRASKGNQSISPNKHIKQSAEIDSKHVDNLMPVQPPAGEGACPRLHLLARLPPRHQQQENAAAALPPPAHPVPSCSSSLTQ
jgi:hypothetical protein